MKKRFRILSFICIMILTVALLASAFLIFGFLYVRKNIDYSSDEELFKRALAFESTVFYGKNYSSEEKYIPVKAESAGSLKKTFVSIDRIPKKLIDGFLSVEDRGFFDHSGVDYKRSAYAALNYIFGGEKHFGASTVTQQVIKNISGDDQVTITRKVSEILRALHIEKIFSKEEILEVYLNIIPMSGNIYGVCEAAKNFFGKDIAELSIAESATLIGITNAPTAYSPYQNPEKCISKRNLVLNTMFSAGVIDSIELEEALKTPLNVINKEENEGDIDSWFVESVIDRVCRDLSVKYGLSSSAARLMLLSGGYSVYTTMDIKAQNILEKHFEQDEMFFRAKALGANYAMVVLDSQNADMIASVGGIGKKKGNRLLNQCYVPHIPASTLKPLAIYAPMIDERIINWATVVDDTPIEFREKDGELTAYPKNSPNVYDGMTTVKDAVRLSKNTVAMKLCKLRGEEKIYSFLKNRLGIDSLVYKENKDGRILSDIGAAPMALGQLTKGIPLVKLTECYTVFPSGGVLNSSRNYLYVKDYEGNTVLSSEKHAERIFSKETSGIMNGLLSEVVNDGTARSLKIKELISTAGKTGTSSGNKDRMFIGYTPYFTAGIWCGSEKNSVSGLAPSPISLWDDIMIEIHEALISKKEERTFDTEGLIYAPYCKDSGEMYCENCIYDPRGDRMEYGYFEKNNIPKNDCTRHILVKYDSVGKGIDVGGCPGENLSTVSLIRIDDRAFPTQIYITDAEYAYRDTDKYELIPSDPSYPYFHLTLPEGEYSGISDRKRQFNCICNKHH